VTEAVSYGIRRRELDNYLLQRSGARLRQGEALKSLQRDGTRWIVNGTISTPLVIGAGGHFCPVARFMGAKLGASEPAIAAKEIEFEMTPAQQDDCRARGDTPELYFCPDLKGYGWCFRKGNYLNIGLGREDNHLLSEQLRNFCDFLKQRGSIPQDIPDNFHGHAYLLYGHSVRKQLDDGMLLVGDAAGLAYPQSGEGIRPAVESGLMAAATIIEANGDYRRQQLQPYANRLAARFGTAAAPAGAEPSSRAQISCREIVGQPMVPPATWCWTAGSCIPTSQPWKQPETQTAGTAGRSIVRSHHSGESPTKING